MVDCKYLAVLSSHVRAKNYSEKERQFVHVDENREERKPGTGAGVV